MAESCNHKFQDMTGFMRAFKQPYITLNRVIIGYCCNCPAIKVTYEYPTGNKEFIVEAPIDKS